MIKIKILPILFLLFICTNVFPTNNDSLLFVEELKKFAFKEIGVELTGDLYTQWVKEEKPYIYLYVSLPDKVQQPVELTSPFIFFGADEIAANEKALELQLSGYHTFCYKTYANSSARLSTRLLSYPREAISFIVFHEFIHNYIEQQFVKIPYEFNEALCDVVGNYGTLKYSQSTQNVNLMATENQIRTNEKIYMCLNTIILKLNKNSYKVNNPKKVLALNESCNKIIHDILKKCNAFQKDRFDFTVNNAYLLKNEYYCKNYFLLKKVLLKQKSIKDFLELMKTLPDKASDCELYLKKFI